MKWTRQQPTKPGFYFYKDSMMDGDPTVVLVKREGSHLNVVGAVDEELGPWGLKDKDPDRSVRWSDEPILPPIGDK